MSVAIIDYGSGNLHSAAKAFERAARSMENPEKIVVTRDPETVYRADRIVLPGVGAFGACARALRESGLAVAARGAIDAGIPFFGVCIGFQLLYDGSDESPEVSGLGVLPGTVGPLPAGVKHPQMQWNQLARVGEPDPAPLRGLGECPWVYFVHSYVPPVGAETVAVCDYGGPVAALVSRGNLWGAQFHPEKSGRSGLALLANFVALAA